MKNKRDLKDQINSLWHLGILSWKLWDQQLPIYHGIRDLPTSVNEVVILCARQFGKSHLGVLLAIEDCLRFPDTCIVIMGPTLKQCREIVSPRLRRISDDAPAGLIRPSKSEGKWFIGDSELVMGGFDVNSTSQRGKTVQNIYIEEIVDSNPDDYVESMRSDLGPALTHSNGGRMTFLTTPPKIPDHPFILETMVKAEINDALYVYTIDDNKALSKEQYDRCVSLAGGRNTVDFRREYLCEIVRDASVLIVPDFKKDAVVTDHRMPRNGFWQLTLDMGGVRDKTVALLHVYDYLADKVLFWDERAFPANTNTQEITAESFAMVEENGVTLSRFVADVPGQIMVDLRELHGFEVDLPPKDDWKAAINNLAVGFSRDRVRINPRCKLLIQTCNSGRFNKQRTDFERTVSLGHCDALAAAMYGYRTQNYDNPYGEINVDRDNFFVKRKNQTDIEKIGNALGSKLSFNKRKF